MKCVKLPGRLHQLIFSFNINDAGIPNQPSNYFNYIRRQCHLLYRVFSMDITYITNIFDLQYQSYHDKF